MPFCYLNGGESVKLSALPNNFMLHLPVLLDKLPYVINVNSMQ